jgi:hypothetical protein
VDSLLSNNRSSGITAVDRKVQKPPNGMMNHMQAIRWLRDLYFAPTERTHIDEAAFRNHVISVLLVTATLGIIIFSCTCVSLIFELNAIRRNQATAAAGLQNGIFSRIDSLLWKTDTFLTEFGATNKSLAAGLTQVRVQVKESTDAQTKSTAAMSQATTTAVKASIAATNDVVQAVVEKPPPVVEVKAEKPMIVAPPAEIKIVPTPPPPPPDEQEVQNSGRKARHGKWNWLRRLWPF